MKAIMMPLAAFLLANLLGALIFVMRGPSAADRMLAALLFSTAGVALLALIAATDGTLSDALVDVALVFALLAAITGIAFAQRAWRRPHEGEIDDAP
jgi:multicomponent Na+:H+ antiporter subunit F